jgi:hypothetical protein
MLYAGLLLTTGYTAGAQTKKETRAYLKENRKALHEERKLYTKSEGRTRLDSRRIDRENYKQRKKMDKAARKQNKGQKYDGNALGNVFEGL